MRTEERRRVMSGRERGFDGFLVRGKFADDSTAEDWWLYKNGSDTEANKVSLAEYVDPITKEFEYRQEEKPKTIAKLFYSNKALVRIDKISGTENITAIRECFRGCTYLETIDLTYTAQGNAVDFNYFCYVCTRLTNIIFNDDFGKGVSQMNGTFYGFKNMKALDVSSFDISKARDLSNIFTSSLIEHLKFSVFDFASATTVANIFNGCTNLTTVEGEIKNLSRTINLADSPLTADSAMVFINGLAEVSTPQTITFSATTKALLSEEQKALIAAKGWIMG